MTKKSTATKTINYRRCVIGGDQTRNLQQLIGAALSTFAKPSDRYEPMNPDSSELRCIAHNDIINGCLCGYMTSFERGASQPVVADDPVASSLRLSALSPPPAKKGSAQQQYVPGVLYFAIFQNHVTYVSTHAMRSSTFESHLNWLLKSRTSELDATTPFALSDEAQKVTKAKIRKSHVKAISIGQPLMSEVVETKAITNSSANQTFAIDEQKFKSKKQKAQSKFSPQGPMFELIRNLFNDENEFEKLGLDEIFEGNLEVWVEIRYPKRKRSQPEDTVKLMDTLGVALRDLEGDQVVLELQNGHRVSGKELKISGTVEAEIQVNKLPDEGRLLTEMVRWLKQQIEHGVIDP